MKRNVVFGVMVCFVGLLLVNCESGPSYSPSPPPRRSVQAHDLPVFLSIRLDADNHGYTIKNSDSVDHRVVVEFSNDRGRTETRDYTVKANDIQHDTSFRYSDGAEARISQAVIIDWL